MRPPLTCRPLLPPEPLLLPPSEPPPSTDPPLLPLPPSEPLPLLDPPLLPLPLPELLPLVDPPPLPLLLVLSVLRSDPVLDDEEHPVASEATPAPRKTARPDVWSVMEASPLCCLFTRHRVRFVHRTGAPAPRAPVESGRRACGKSSPPDWPRSAWSSAGAQR